MIKKYLKSSFVKDSFYMVLSTVGMQLIAILTIPILSRYFSPDVFGFHATYRSVLVILSILLTLKLETAIVLPKLEKEKNDLLLATLANTVVVSCFLLVVYFTILLFGFDLLEYVFDVSSLGLFLLVFAGSFLVALSNTSQGFLVSQKKFKSISISRLILPSSFFLISIFLYYAYNNYLVLIIAHLCSYVFLNIYLTSRFKIKFLGFTKRIYKNSLKKYKDIVRYTSSNSLVNTISSNIPSLVLLGFYGATPLGLYAVGAKIITIPSQLVSASMSQIFYKKFVDIYNEDKSRLFPFVKKLMFSLLSLGIVIFGIAYLVIPYIIPVFLGEEWIDAIPIVKYLCFWQALVIANSPVSTLTILLNKQKGFLIYQSFLLVFRFLALWIPFYLAYSFNQAVLCYALVGVFFNIILFSFLMHISRQTKTNI